MVPVHRTATRSIVASAVKSRRTSTWLAPLTLVGTVTHQLTLGLILGCKVPKHSCVGSSASIKRVTESTTAVRLKVWVAPFVDVLIGGDIGNKHIVAVLREHQSREKGKEHREKDCDRHSWPLP